MVVAPDYFNFNPRSREGSDMDLKNNGHQRCMISIHAPARGATVLVSGFPLLIRFQSTLPRGERLPRQSMDGGRFSISIHAPARGATAKTDKFAAKAHIVLVYFCHIKQYIIYFTLFRRRCIENFPEFPVRVLQGFYVYRQFAPEIFTETRGLSCPRFPSRRCAPPYFCSCCPDSKTAGCPSSRQ